MNDHVLSCHYIFNFLKCGSKRLKKYKPKIMKTISFNSNPRKKRTFSLGDQFLTLLVHMACIKYEQSTL